VTDAPTTSPGIGVTVEVDEDDDRPTGEYASLPSFVTTARGERVGPWAFARLVEAIATGEIGRSDRIEFMGRPAASLTSIDELARFLPVLTAETTSRMGGVGSPDFVDDVSPGALVRVLLGVIESEGTGVLFAEGPTESRRLVATATGHSGRKELYFVEGKLSHIASSNASELLGEYLLRRGAISRAELDFTLAVLPRYGGRIGDTLVSLGLLSSLDIFQAIREQGRDRLVDLFQWKTGSLTFYKGQTAPHVEFPLDLDLPNLIFAGLEAAAPGDAPLEAWRSRLGDIVRPSSTPRPRLRAAPWPPIVRRVLEAGAQPRAVRDLVQIATQGDPTAASRALLGVEVLLAAKLLSSD
jgi:serine/threonine-protein kinase